MFVDDPLTPALAVPVDLAGVLSLDDGTAWIGFTASTGLAGEWHDLLAWSGNCLPTTTTTTVPAATTTTVTTLLPSTTTTIPPGGELCDNCADDDGNGLVDQEDPACCVQAAGMRLHQVMMVPRKGGTRLLLGADLGTLGLGRPPVVADLKLQIHAEDGEAFCARVPASRLKAKKSGLRFEDPKATVTEAHGLTTVILRVKRTGDVGIKARGSRMSLRMPASDHVRMTWAVGGPGRAERCASVMGILRPSRKGSMRYP